MTSFAALKGNVPTIPEKFVIEETEWFYCWCPECSSPKGHQKFLFKSHLGGPEMKLSRFFLLNFRRYYLLKA